MHTKVVGERDDKGDFDGSIRNLQAETCKTRREREIQGTTTLNNNQRISERVVCGTSLKDN